MINPSTGKPSVPSPLQVARVASRPLAEREKQAKLASLQLKFTPGRI
jgi:hypothetical protein